MKPYVFMGKISNGDDSVIAVIRSSGFYLVGFLLGWGTIYTSLHLFAKNIRKQKSNEGGKTVRRDKGKFDTKAKDLFRACEKEYN